MALARNVMLPVILAATTAIILHYPNVRRDPTVIDDYFGTKIADPYRWLEDPDSPETQKFVQEQNKLTEFYLSQVKSRESIRSKFTSVVNYARSTAYQKVCGKYYTVENSGLQNQGVIYVRTSVADPNPRVFLDPNKFSEDGTGALNSYSFSRNGKLFVYATAQSGSDWKTIFFMNTSTGQKLKDVLEFSKRPSLTWTVDSLGVFYSRYAKPSNASGGLPLPVVQNEQIYYHVVGTTLDNDILIAEFPEAPHRLLWPQVSDSGDYLIILGQDSYKAKLVYLVSLKGGVPSQKNQLIPVFPNSKDALYTYVTHRGPYFLFITSKDAPNYKIISVKVDLRVPTQQENSNSSGQVILSSTFLQEDPKNPIQWATVIDIDKILVCYLEDVKHTLELRSLNDSHLIHKFDLPTGAISSFYREDEADTEFFFLLENFLTPGIIFHCQVHGRVNCTIIKQLKAGGNIDVNNFVIQQKFYPSKDETLIPMYILRKNNTIIHGSAPVLLYGYGGFGISTLPTFSAFNLFFADSFNGVYVLANIRGGGEYGEKWHQAGSALNKQNAFDDFQAAAEYLIQNNYTNPSKLSIKGESNGGLMIGVCVNQRPELYGAAIAQVGVMDMLRFQKFTNAFEWCSEFGCSDNETEFKSLIQYSPLHNIRLPANESVQYPAVLVTTADHDDRVVPAHSYKYTAELQFTIGRSARQTNPLLLRVETKAGHGVGKPTTKQIDESTDIFAFLSRTLDIEFN